MTSFEDVTEPTGEYQERLARNDGPSRLRIRE